LKIEIHYPFHPLCGIELEVACPTKKNDGLVTVIDPQGIRLKVPLWMTSPQAENHQLAEVEVIGINGLLLAHEIWRYHYDKMNNENKRNKIKS